MITCHQKFFISRMKERGYYLSEVSACIVAKQGVMWTIDTDHPAYPRAPKKTTGPGTVLRSMLAAVGIRASSTCKCNKMAKQMDEWGPVESLNHIEEIVDVMEATAKKRKLPFLRTAGRALVRIACWKAKRKGNGK